MKKDKEKNTEVNETGKKKKKLPIIITVVALILVIGACGSKGGSNKSEPLESSSSDNSVSETTEETSKEEAINNSDSSNQPENFINDVKDSIKDAVGADEYITNVSLSDNVLTISVDLSKADTSIVPIQDLAVIRAQSITDSFLDLNQYDDLWKEIIVDFGDIGFVKRTQNDIVETNNVGRYFEINELTSET